MVKIMDVLYALMIEFEKLTQVKNVLEQNEDDNPPYFYHYISIILNDRLNKHLQNITINVQTVYIGTDDNEMISTLEENLLIFDKLRGFLIKGRLNVQGLRTSFKYDVKKVDDLLAFTITFNFIDEIEGSFEIGEIMEQIQMKVKG